MIFINSSGDGKTSIETILDIVGCLEFTYVVKCKSRSVKGMFQTVVKNEKNKALCIINSHSGDRRKIIIDAINEEYPLVPIQDHD